MKQLIVFKALAEESLDTCLTSYGWKAPTTGSDRPRLVTETPPPTRPADSRRVVALGQAAFASQLTAFVACWRRDDLTFISQALFLHHTRRIGRGARIHHFAHVGSRDERRTETRRTPRQRETNGTECQKKEDGLRAHEARLLPRRRCWPSPAVIRSRVPCHPRHER